MAIGHTLTSGMGIASGLDGSIELMIRLGYSPSTAAAAPLVDIYIQPSLNAVPSRPRPVLNTEVISIQPTLNTAITIPERI